MLKALRQAFSPLDTSAVDTAIAGAARAHKDVTVRARALRMDVGCGEAVSVAWALARVPTVILDHFFMVPGDTPADMKDLLGKL